MVKKLRYPMIFLLICLFSFVLSSCANPVDQFMEKVDSSDYQEARDIYNEEIYGNLEDEKTVYNELLTRLENAIADYNVGTIILSLNLKPPLLQPKHYTSKAIGLTPTPHI